MHIESDIGFYTKNYSVSKCMMIKNYHTTY